MTTNNTPRPADHSILLGGSIAARQSRLLRELRARAVLTATRRHRTFSARYRTACGDGRVPHAPGRHATAQLPDWADV